MKRMNNKNLLLAKMIDAELDTSVIPDMNFVRTCTAEIEKKHPAPTKDDLESRLEDLLKKGQ